MLGPSTASMARLLFSLLLASVCVSGATAQTAPEGTDERALARSLFHQGLECLDAEDFQCAAERFARSQELRPSPVVAYNLASALARIGQVVRAAELLRWVRRSDANEQVKTAAATLLQQVTPRVASWTLQTTGSPEGATFYLDDRALPEQAVGVRAPVDPGEHRVDARRNGETVATVEFSVTEGGRVPVSIEVPPPPVPTPEELAAQAGEPRVITVVREDPAQQAAERAHRRRVRRGAIIGAALAVVAAVVIVAVVVHEPEQAQPIPGNFGPGVVEIGE